MDIQAAVTKRTGVGRYTKSLAEALGRARGDDELELFCFDFKRQGLPVDAPGVSAKSCRWLPGRLANLGWKTIGWPPFDMFAGSADLYHFPNFILPPLRKGKSIVTIHDVSFFRMPETTEAKNLRYLKKCLGDSAERADAVIAVSQFTADEIVDTMKIDAGKIRVVGEGVEPCFTPPSDEQKQAMRGEYRLEKPYVLFVGTIEPRKNIPFLIEVFEKMTDFDGELVIAGMLGWKYEPIVERIKSSSRAESIRYVDYVTDEHLPALYGGAELLLFPSLYEGFGLPPLECMACGTGVVASNRASLPEVLGDGAVIVDDFEADEWAAKVQAALGDAQLVDRGKARAAEFTWDAAAEQTWSVYREL